MVIGYKGHQNMLSYHKQEMEDQKEEVAHIHVVHVKHHCVVKFSSDL